MYSYGERDGAQLWRHIIHASVPNCFLMYGLLLWRNLSTFHCTMAHQNPFGGFFSLHIRAMLCYVKIICRERVTHLIRNVCMYRPRTVARIYNTQGKTSERQQHNGDYVLQATCFVSWNSWSEKECNQSVGVDTWRLNVFSLFDWHCVMVSADREQGPYRPWTCFPHQRMELRRLAR